MIMTNVDAYLEDARPFGTPGVLTSLILQPQYGYVPQQFNPGYPEVREVSERRPSQNGTFDFTEYFGARPINLQVAIASELVPDPYVTDQVLEDRLRLWMQPNIRCFLYIKTNPRDEYRRYKMRATNLDSSLNFITKTEFRQVSMAWKGVDGISESATLQSVLLQPGTSIELGRTYDQAYDKAYAASSVIGGAIARNNGTAPVFPVVTIYGPCTQPRIENQTTGKKLEFLSSYALVAGEYLVIDFATGTVAMSGDLTNSRYQYLDFASGISEWWSLIPGDNAIRYYPLVSAAPTSALVEWRSAYI